MTTRGGPGRLPGNLTLKGNEMEARVTEWGITIGVKEIPEPEFCVSKDGTCYGYRIEAHGLLIYSESKDACRARFAKSYGDETDDYRLLDSLINAQPVDAAKDLIRYYAEGGK